MLLCSLADARAARLDAVSAMRRVRLSAALRLEDVAAVTGVDSARLSRLERGLARVKPAEVERLKAVYGDALR
jgi:transcriptional regulator with XRE-family HTH domain